MKKILFIMFICIFIVVTVAAPSYGAKDAVAAPSYGAKDAAQGAAATNAPKIEIITPDADLGEVEKNKIFDYKIEVKNVGKEVLVITNVSSSCGCLALTDERWTNRANGAIEPVIIKPKKSIFISARVDTNRISGEFERMIHVYSNDAENPDVMWKVRGSVAAELALPGDKVAAKFTLPDGRDGRASSVTTDVKDAKVIMFFHSPGCKDCREIMEKFLPQIKEKYRDRILIVDYNIDNFESYEFLLSLEDKYDERSKKGFFNPKPPIVFVEDRLLYGTKEIKKNLENIVKGENG